MGAGQKGISFMNKNRSSVLEHSAAFARDIVMLLRKAFEAS